MKRFFRGWMEKKQNGPPDDLLDRRDRPCLIPPRFDIPSAAGAFSAGSLVEVEEVPLHSHYRAQAPPRTLGLRAPRGSSDSAPEWGSEMPSSDTSISIM